MQQGATTTGEGIRKGVEWGGDKVGQGAEWSADKAQKGWSATRKGAQTFRQELTFEQHAEETNPDAELPESQNRAH